MKSPRTIFFLIAFMFACKPFAETKAQQRETSRAAAPQIPPSVSAARRSPVAVVAHNVLPSVVNIQTEATIRQRQIDPFFDPWGFFSRRPTERQSQSLGSGFVWSS